MHAHAHGGHRGDADGAGVGLREPRDDKTRGFRAPVRNRGLAWQGFSPRVSPAHETRTTNAQVDDHERTGGELRFVKLFQGGHDMKPVIFTAAMLGAAVALAACSGSGSDGMAAGPNLNSALHADFVLVDQRTGAAALRAPWQCEGRACSSAIVIPGTPPIPFMMTCEGNLCTFESDVRPGNPLGINLGRGFAGRAAGAAQIETALGPVDLETTRGVTHADIRDPAALEVLNIRNVFSGWGDWGAFVISYALTPQRLHGTPIANTAGDSTFENPVAGGATWSGIMAASTYRGVQVEGDADLTLDFAAMNVDVALTEITDGSDTSYDDINWRSLALENGGFAAAPAENDSIQGRFYGPEHEEAGGIFEKNGMIGGFHAIRDEE